MLILFMAMVGISAQAQSITHVDPTNIDPTQRASVGQTDPRQNRLWFLDRLDQEGYPLDQHYAYCDDGSFTKNLRFHRVNVYIVDTGVRRDHIEFGDTDRERKSRIDDGIAISRQGNGYAETVGATTSCEETSLNGTHGTSVASFIVGKNVGVAKGAHVIPIKLPCVAPDSAEQQARDLTEAIRVIRDDLYGTQGRWQKDPDERFLVSFSTFVEISSNAQDFTDLRNALVDLVNGPAKIVIFASANNPGLDACETLPGSAHQDDTRIITVGATMMENASELHPRGTGGDGDPHNYFNDEVFQQYPLFDSNRLPQDVRWDIGPGDSTARRTVGGYTQTEGSNFGRCVAMWAPAWNTTSASGTGPFAYRDGMNVNGGGSGTSFAAPMAAGVAARFVSMMPEASGAQIRDALLNTAIPNAIEVATWLNPRMPKTLNNETSDTVPADVVNNNLLLQASDVMFMSRPHPVPGSASGSMVTITIDVAAASSQLTYEWYKSATRGDILSKVADSNSPSIVVPNDSSYYWVRVSGICTIGPRAFSRDSYPGRARLETCATQLSNIVILPSHPTIAKGATTSLFATATNGVTFQWYRGNRGDTSNALSSGQALTTAQLQTTTAYWVRVTSSDNCTLDSDSVIVRVAEPPTIVRVTLNPTDSAAAVPNPLNILENKTVLLTVLATGTDLHYKWTQDGNRICFRPPLVAQAVDPVGYEQSSTNQCAVPAGGSLTVEVSNGWGASQSQSVTIQSCNNTSWVSDVSGTVVAGKLQVANTLGASGTFQWYQGELGDMSVPLSGNTNVITVDVPSVPTTYWARVSFPDGCPGHAALADTKPYTYVPGPRDDCGQFFTHIDVTRTPSLPRLAITCTHFDAVKQCRETYTWYAGTPANHSSVVHTGNVFDPPAPKCGDQYFAVIHPDPTLWSCPDLNSDVIVLCPMRSRPVSHTQSAGPGMPVGLTLVDDGDHPTVTWYTGNDPHDTSQIVGTGTSTIVAPTESTTYHAYSTSTCEGGPHDDISDPADVNIACVPPVIQVQPVSTTVASSTVTASVIATGTGLTYSWRDVEHPNTELDNGSAASYTFLSTADKKSLTVFVVVGSCGSTVTSAPATLSAVTCGAPHIDSFTSYGLSTLPGEAINLSITMSAPEEGGAYTYQWYRGDGIPLPGATHSSVVVNTQKMDTFYVHVEKSCATTPPAVFALDSPKAYVKVTSVCELPPLYVTQSAPFLPDVGGSITFTAYCDWPNVNFTWYKGVVGDTRNQLPADPGHANQLTLTDVKAVWVRASLSCGATRDSATFSTTRRNCGPVFFDTQPQPTSVRWGDSGTLSAHAYTLNGDIDYGWFAGALTEGVPGEHFENVRVNPLKSTRYFARAVSLGCGTYSDTFMTTVRVASCDGITITSWPASDTWTDSGTGVTPTVGTTQSGLTYQWFAGDLADETNPLTGITSNPTFTSGPLAADSKFWVRVSNGSCVADSDTIVVHVCTPPAFGNYQKTFNNIPGQDVWIGSPAAGTGVTYEWFEGASGTTSNPIGSTEPLLFVRPFATTQYWERATSHCGATGTDARVAQTQSITVSICPDVTTPVAAQSMVMPGGTTTISVAATGNLLTYQWYVGSRGDLSHPLTNGNGPTVTTPPLTQPTTFWVAVMSGSCPAYSDEVIVDVCTGPAVWWTQISTQVTYGQGQTITVGYSPVAYTTLDYYEGQSGDVAHSTLINAGSMNAALGLPAATTTKSYWVRARNGSCYADTPTMTVNVCIPTITTQPTSVISTGNPIALNVAANTTGLTYQWYEGNAGDMTHPIAAGTAATLTFTPAYTANYWARVTGSCSRYADSNVVTVTRCAAPAITTQPSPRIVARGSSTSVSVTATGTTLTYQWYQGNAGVTTSPIANATSASLTVTPTYTTNYWVRVGGYCGSIDSSTVQVSVTPIITAQPVDVLVTKGAGASLSVTVDANPVVYQWYRGAANDTSNAICTNSATCTTPAVFSDTQYWVRVTSGLSSVDSNVVTAHVCQAPTVSVTQPANQQSNANVSLTVVNPDTSHTYAWYNGVSGDTSSLIGSGVGSYVISQHPTQTANYWVRDIGPACSADSATINVPICTPNITSQPANVNVNQGSQVSLTVAGTGTPTLTYQWYTGASGNTASPVSGATSATLTFTASSTQTYWVRVTNGVNGAACYINSNAATVTVCIPPSISTHPTNPIITRGQSSTIGVTASGSNLQYQWYQGAKGVTTTLIGSNSNVLTVTPQTTTSYWVRVSGCSQTADSNAGTVSVYPIINTQPANVRITKNTSATFSVTADASPVLYQWYAGVSPDMTTLINGATNATYTTPALAADANYWVRVTSGSATVFSNTATATICTSSVVNVTNNQVSGANATLSIATPNSGETYSWYQGTTGTTTTPVLLNTAATSIPVQPTQSTYYWVRTFSATCSSDSVSVLVPICYPKVNTPTGNLGITSGQQTTLTVSATGTPNLTYQWYQGTSGNTAQPINGATSTSVTVQPGSNTSYWVRVTSSTAQGCYADSAAVTVTVCQLPVITTNPQPQPYPTSTYSRYISVVATGSGLQYHWYEGLKGVTTTPVGTNASQIAITPGVTKYYWVRVSNACGSVDSDAALQSVAPTVSVSPDPTICSGTTATLSVSASGTMLSYQWYQTTAGTTNDTSHPVGTPNSTTFTTPALTQSAVYWCRVTSGNNWTNSTNITVTVSLGPTIGAWYTPTSASCGYFQVSVDGNLGDFYYAWYKGNLGDTTQQVGGSYYMGVCATSGTKYWVRVTDPTTGCHTDSATAIP